MKIVICSLVLLMTTGVAAQGDSSSQSPAKEERPKVETFKHKITCFLDYEANETFNGKEERVAYKRQTTESVRTTWKVGNVEHRFSEWKNFVYTDDAVTFRFGRTVVKVTTDERDGFQFETIKQTSYSFYDPTGKIDSKEGGIDERITESIKKSTVIGNTETLVESIVDGKPDETAVGSVTVKYPTVNGYFLVITEKTPYKYTYSNGETAEVLKEITSCQFEKLD